jgi:proteic killer suppression protein
MGKLQMIRTFVHKGLEDVFHDDSKKGIQPKHAQKIGDILDLLDAAVRVEDMNFPGSGLHQMKGDRKGEWAVKVSGNWRITFKFSDGHAYDVNLEDYH